MVGEAETLMNLVVGTERNRFVHYKASYTRETKIDGSVATNLRTPLDVAIVCNLRSSLIKGLAGKQQPRMVILVQSVLYKASFK